MTRSSEQDVDLSLDAMRRLFRLSFKDFCVGEVDNIKNGVSERNLCQRLSIPLERRAHAAGLHQYRADAEYNRSNDGKIKTIFGENTETINITCDLILHSRGCNREQDNLIAVEMKRSSHPEAEKRKDRIRLTALTREPGEGVWPADEHTRTRHVCDYVVGYFIELHILSNVFFIEEYVHGRVTSSTKARF